MDRETWHTVIHGVTKSWTRLKDWTELNLPCVMDLTFQVPVSHSSYSISLYFHYQLHPQLGIVLLWLHLLFLSQVISLFFSNSTLDTYCPLRSSSFSIISFCLFILLKGFSRQEYWSGLPLPSPVDSILSELFTLTLPSWLALHGMSHSFIEIDKAVVHVINLINFLWLWFSFCLPFDG